MLCAGRLLDDPHAVMNTRGWILVRSLLAQRSYGIHMLRISETFDQDSQERRHRLAVNGHERPGKSRGPLALLNYLLYSSLYFSLIRLGVITHQPLMQLSVGPPGVQTGSELTLNSCASQRHR